MRTSNLLSFLFFFSSLLIFQNCTSDSTLENPSLSSEESASSVENNNFTKQHMQAPLENIDVAFQQFDVNSVDGQTINLNSGTSIEIPANAFVDQNGEVVTETVTIKYREFHTAAEILVSGIPMKAFFNGEAGNMQTAGMFEIQASANNREVFVTEEKQIMVNMASFVGGNEYDFWKFDPEKGNWENNGNSQSRPNLGKEKTQKMLASLPDVLPPTRPVEFDKKKPVLNFDINIEEYPELKQMNNVFWQYSGKGENPESAKWIFDEEWDFANIEKGNGSNEYKLILKNKKKQFITSVCPSQKGNAFKKAMKKFNQQMEEYKNNEITTVEKKEFMRRQADFIRSTAIEEMGIYNYDILLKEKYNIPLAAKFNFGNSIPKSQQKVNVYLITNDGRSVVAFPFQDWKKFGINPETDNRLIAILPNNKIATFSQKDFTAEMDAIKKAKGGEYIFKMKVKEDPINAVADLEKAMNIIS